MHLNIIMLNIVFTFMKSTEAQNILQCFSFFMESKIKILLIFLYGLVWINFHMLIRITDELKKVLLKW